jgi:hypothetical protein
MNELIKDLLMQVLTYFAVFIITLVVINFLTRGYVFKYIIAKGGVNKGKVLVRAWTATGKYYVVGKIKEQFLIYKGRDKEIFRYELERGIVYSEMGVNVIDIDEHRQLVIRPDQTEYLTNDPARFDDLLTRAIQKPSLNNTPLIIILVLCIVILLAVVGVGFMGYKNQQAITTLSDNIANLAIIK